LLQAGITQQPLLVSTFFFRRLQNSHKGWSKDAPVRVYLLFGCCIGGHSLFFSTL
jgi:hypothetical protein